MPADVRSAFISVLVSSGGIEFEGETTRSDIIIFVPLPITRLSLLTEAQGYVKTMEKERRYQVTYLLY